MKNLILIALICFALTNIVDDRVFSELSLNGGKVDIMINFNEQVQFNEQLLDTMTWEQKGHYVLNLVFYFLKKVDEKCKCCSKRRY
jgi:hypothetical protein